MSVAPASANVPVPAGPGGYHSCAAKWSVGLSAACGLVMATAVTIVAILYAMGSEGAIEDTWAGFLLGTAVILPGLLGTLVAFVLAVVARVRHERWALLWLPLGLLPGVALFLVLGEAFWWE